jgi:hypothetical protein
MTFRQQQSAVPSNTWGHTQSNTRASNFLWACTYGRCGTGGASRLFIQCQIAKEIRICISAILEGISGALVAAFADTELIGWDIIRAPAFVILDDGEGPFRFAVCLTVSERLPYYAVCFFCSAPKTEEEDEEGKGKGQGKKQADVMMELWWVAGESYLRGC